MVVVHDSSDKAVFYAQLVPSPKFDANSGIWAHSAPLRCLFPEEGRYTVQLWFFQEEASDVLKGELPFSVVKGSD